MKILLVIDHFGSGGAQRQMVNLACGLKAKGHDVEMLIYFPGETFFRPLIDESEIPVHEVTKGRGFSFKVLWRLITLLRTERFDGVISFLTSPNIYCELARLANPGVKLVVSERSSKALDGSCFSAVFRRVLHGLADYIVSNSKTQTAWLSRFPWLRTKARTIYNGYSIPSYIRHQPAAGRNGCCYLVVGRVDAGKNGLRLIEALALYHQRHGVVPPLSWAGRRENSAASKGYIDRMEQLLIRHPEVAACWQWLGERNDVPELLASHDALIHPSLYEGLPNVVCEAFIAGCPVIASNVCDHPVLVEDGVRGLLCSPLSAESICAAIERFEVLSAVERMQMGINARKYAEERLSMERMVKAYESLLEDSAMPQSS